MELGLAELRQPSADEAGRAARKALAEAARRGYPGLELEARRVLAELREELGERAQVREEWSGLGGDAKQRGFLRIAEIAQRHAGTP